MTICAVIDLQTNQQVNLIIAEKIDFPPDGCKLVEIPDGFYWNGLDVVPIEVGVDLGLTGENNAD
jgi:hypothetical protein